MPLTVEYKSSGNKFWRVIIAPVAILLRVAKLFGRSAVIYVGDEHERTHMHIPMRVPADEREEVNGRH